MEKSDEADRMGLGAEAIKKSGGLVEFVPRQPYFRKILSLLASTRNDGMYTRLMFLGLLIDHPCTKVEALKTLKISRPYLDRILEDWSELGIISVRGMSPFPKPKMTIYLKIRPVLRVTRLDGEVEEINDANALMGLAKVLASPVKTRILLKMLSAEESKEVATSPRWGKGPPQKLVSAVGVSRQALYKHLKELISAKLILKISAGGEWEHRKREKYGRILRRIIEESKEEEDVPYSGEEAKTMTTPPHSFFGVNFKLIEFKLKLHRYPS